MFRQTLFPTETWSVLGLTSTHTIHLNLANALWNNGPVLCVCTVDARLQVSSWTVQQVQKVANLIASMPLDLAVRVVQSGHLARLVHFELNEVASLLENYVDLR